MVKSTESSNHQADQSARYRIILQGCLREQWSAWFDGYTITPNDQNQTVMIGPVHDQAALHGLLRKICALGIPLIAINRLDSDEETTTL